MTAICLVALLFEIVNPHSFLLWKGALVRVIVLVGIIASVNLYIAVLSKRAKSYLIGLLGLMIIIYSYYGVIAYIHP